jgi:proline iminopeptidase
MKIKVNGVDLFFDVEGLKYPAAGPALAERPTLLLVHGGPGFDHAVFKPYYSRFRDLAQIIYIDLRANGRSEAGVASSWTLAQWADDLKGFCDALAIEKPIVLGVSFGGFVAMAYAARYPQHPGKLVLESTAARTHLDRKLAAFERMGGPRARRAAGEFWTRPSHDNVGAYQEVCMPLYSPADHDPDMARRSIMRLESFFAFAGAGNEMMTYDLRAGLRAIHCPTLVAVGKLDPLTPPEDAAEIVESLPPGVGRLQVFDRAGHGIMRACPDEFEATLRGFLSS